MGLVREYATGKSEGAFAELVARHLPWVYATALRRVGTPQLAEEVAQAVFIILARKAAALSSATILPAWLHRATRFAAADALKTQRRRQAREQEAWERSTMNATDEAAWRQIEPLLETALDGLSDADRAAVVLRFYESKSLGEVGAALGVSEEAAKKRVSRALEKLRQTFCRQGTVLTAGAIASAVAAGSVQGAPVGLAQTVATVSLAQGAAASGGAWTIAKGTLKLMAWAKAKLAIATAAIVITAGTATVMVSEALSQPSSPNLRQVLADGSVLAIHQVKVGPHVEITHGNPLESILGNSIPPKGLALPFLTLKRPDKQAFESQLGSYLLIEMHLSGPNAGKNSLWHPAFYRQFRCVLSGEKGLEYVVEFMGFDGFKPVKNGYCGLILTGRFPRDSQWLGLRVEQRESEDKPGPWTQIARFKMANPAPAVVEPWTASASPITNSVEGLDLILNGISVQSVPHLTNDIWNHIVTAPWEVRSNGLLLTNWSVPYSRVLDASGNWHYALASHISLDPRYVWKIEADFEPESGFPEDSRVTFALPDQPSAFSVKVKDVPVKINWDGNQLRAEMPTNNPNLALKFVGVEDDQERKGKYSGGSWSQFGFGFGSFATKVEDGFTLDYHPIEATVAIVPNRHATFYIQPKLLKAAEKP